MPVVTIGEYGDPKDTQRDIISSQVIDLSEGEATSKPFDGRTRSIRVCADVSHLFSMGADAWQMRPADAVESHDVGQGQAWAMSFKVEA